MPKHIKHLSTAAQNALPSGVRRMFELAKKYNDSINLTLGEPGFTAPDHIIEAGIKGLRDKKPNIPPTQASRDRGTLLPGNWKRKTASNAIRIKI